MGSDRRPKRNHLVFMDVSIVVPCYNSAASVPLLAERIDEVLDAMSCQWELILIYDFSRDNTWEAISSIQLKSGEVVSVELARNVGQQSAVMCGFEMARGKYIVTMDDDLQHDPEHIPHMLEKLKTEDLDVVMAYLKPTTEQRTWVRNVGTWIVSFLAHHILSLQEKINFSSYRVIRSEVAKEALRLNSPSPVVGYALLTVTHRCRNYEVPLRGRHTGTSTYSLLALIRYFLNMLFNHSVLPLQYIMVISIFFVLFSFGLAFIYAIQYLLGAINVGGFATLIVVLTTMFGIVFSVLGIISAYLLYNIRTSMKNPRYFVRQQINAPPVKKDV
ncbi:MAG: glycosyltransferase [Pseudomonadales bacterium]|nr:glycosyltransferase [Pseudomonadales bacterium]